MFNSHSVCRSKPDTQSGRLCQVPQTDVLKFTRKKGCAAAVLHAQHCQRDRKDRKTGSALYCMSGAVALPSKEPFGKMRLGIKGLSKRVLTIELFTDHFIQNLGKQPVESIDMP